MRVYHRTPAAVAIMTHGFRDAEGTYGTLRLHRGVWVADRPLDVNEGAEGEDVLTLDVPQEELLPWEWIEDSKGYREFMVPAELLNRYGPPTYWEDPEWLDVPGRPPGWLALHGALRMGWW